MGEDARLFDAFQFSERHEVALLLAKLTIESPLIEAWIIVENTFSHKGTKKPAELSQLLEDDRRFDQFRDRLRIVSLDENFVAQAPHSTRDRLKLLGKQLLPSYNSTKARVVFDERPFFYAEQRQRDAALEALFDVSGLDGWVMVSDVDEFVDCSNGARRDQILDALRSGANVTRFRRQRFTFDIDNMCPAVRFVGCAAIRYLNQNGRGLQSIRLGQDGYVSTLEPLVYEYSFCYPRASIDRKLATYIHANPGTSPVDVALECNHGFFASSPDYIDQEQWYRTVELESVGAPAYVLDHASGLRTGNVNLSYAEARSRRYPHLFGWAP